MNNTVYVLINDSDNYDFTLHATKEGAVNAALQIISDNIHYVGDEHLQDKIMNIVEFGDFDDHLNLLGKWGEYTGDTTFLSIEEKPVYL